MTNPNIADAGSSTRFGAPRGPDPRGSQCRLPPWSIKNHVKRLLCFPLTHDGIPSDCELLEWLRGPERSHVTLSMMVAVQRIILAMENGHEMIKLIDYVEGKPSRKSSDMLLPCSDPFC